MKAAMKAMIPAVVVATALLLTPLAEANDRHDRGHGNRGYHSDGYSRGSRHGDYSRPYGYSSRPYGYSTPYPRYYRPYSRGYYYAPPYYYSQPYPYAPAYPYSYGYDGYGYDYYAPPLPYRGPRPRFGIGLYFGF